MEIENIPVTIGGLGGRIIGRARMNDAGEVTMEFFGDNAKEVQDLLTVGMMGGFSISPTFIPAVPKND